MIILIDIFYDIFSYVPKYFAGIMIVAILSGLIMRLVTRNNKRALLVSMFSVYDYLVIAITLLSRMSNSRKRVMSLIPFGTMHNNYLSQKWVIENIILFIPYGVFLMLLFYEKIRFRELIYIAAITSLLIESTQIITGRGNFEVDDIITNTFGAVIGYVLCSMAIIWQTYRVRVKSGVAQGEEGMVMDGIGEEDNL
jgi:glycopeptide antibiotics resistance protein